MLCIAHFSHENTADNGQQRLMMCCQNMCDREAKRRMVGEFQRFSLAHLAHQLLSGEVQALTCLIYDRSCHV